MTTLGTVATWAGRGMCVAIIVFALWLVATETARWVRQRRDVRRARALGRDLGARRARGYARGRV